MPWAPPGKDCGACGVRTCSGFLRLLGTGEKSAPDCPYYAGSCSSSGITGCAAYSGKDILGFEYDFVLKPFPGEPSAQKFIQPFRPDLVERWGIQAGDIVTGRPMGQGCPVYHGLRVLAANEVTGVVTCHTVGPIEARKGPVHDVQAYHVIGFEGIAETQKREPAIGLRQRFLPGSCMLQLSHTGVVNMILKKSFGTHVRIEDIRILS
ncbi:MAG: (Fe-S)-binding protein [Methanoregulaceae archaeon]